MNQGVLGNPSFAAREIVSQTLVDIPSNPLPGAGLHVSVMHGLPVAPHFMRWVLVCVSTNAGYDPGDEVDVVSMTTAVMMTTWASATACGLALDVNRTLAVNSKTASTQTNIAAASWKFKCYARCFHS